MIKWGAVALVTVCACASETADIPPCEIAGTYLMTGTLESSSPGCSSITTEGTDAAPTGGRTVTISARPPGYSGPDFLIELQGATGSCAADFSGQCRIQSKCNYRISDASDPANNVGTKQLSLTFDRNGFSGLDSTTTPPAKSLPKGCSYTAAVVGTRR